MKVATIEKKLLKNLSKRPNQYVRIDRYQETYLENYKDILYELDIYAGWTDKNDFIHQRGISITANNLKKLIIVAAFKLDDLLDDYNSVAVLE